MRIMRGSEARQVVLYNNFSLKPIDFETWVRHLGGAWKETEFCVSFESLGANILGVDGTGQKKRA